MLAVNILGRFLLNSDKNIRYVALNTLLRTVQADISAVQRHRSTILECLKDPDVSIRKRAMELSFALINAQNIRTMAKELLIFLEKADSEFKTHCSSRMVHAAERFAPTIRWHHDTLLSVLIAAGNYVRDDVISSTIQLISSSPVNEQTYIALKLWEALLANKDIESKQPLIQVAFWVVGEYGDLLMYGERFEDLDRPNEMELIDFYQKILWSPQVSVISKQYALVSLAKLSTRLQPCPNEVQAMICSFSSHLHVDLQQRGLEFAQLFKEYNHLRSGLLEKMPPMQVQQREGRQNGNGLLDDISSADLIEPDTETETANVLGSIKMPPSDSNILLDLLGTADDVVLPAPTIATANTSNQQPNNQDLLDLLGLDLSTPEAAASVTSSTAAVVNPVPSSASMDFSAFSTLPTVQPPNLSSPLDSLGFGSSNGSDLLVNSILSQPPPLQNSTSILTTPPPLISSPPATTSTTFASDFMAAPIIPASNSSLFDDLTNFNQGDVSREGFQGIP